MGAKKDKQNECEPLLTYEQLAETSKLTVSFIRKARSAYGLPSYKIGGAVRFRLSEFEVWLKQYQTAG
jgi:excisionase family DNA binding protein